MKVRFECSVESKTKIEETIIEYLGKEYTFTPDAEGYLASINILATAPQPEKFKTGFSQLPKHKENSLIYFHIDHDFKDLIVEEFQYFEGMFAFGGNLQKINWDDLLIEMIPETPEEKEQIKLNKFGFKPQISNDPRELTQQDIAQIVLRRQFLDFTSVYLSFFREGTNDYVSRRFINSFYNFYFIIEAFYGNGRWKNFEIKREFEMDKDLVRILRKKLTFLKANNMDHYNDIVRMVKGLRDKHGNPLKKRMGASGVIHLIVETRGALHHFSIDENRQASSPFRHEDYNALAGILLTIAGDTLNLLMEAVEKMVFKELKKTKLANPI